MAEVLGENYLVDIKRVGIEDVFDECGKNDELLRKYIMLLKYITNVDREVIKKRSPL